MGNRILRAAAAWSGRQPCDNSPWAGNRNGFDHARAMCLITYSKAHRCLASLALAPTDDMYFLVAFFDETAFAQKNPSFHIRRRTVGVVLVSYCSAGDGGALAQQPLMPFVNCNIPPPLAHAPLVHEYGP